MRRRGRGSHRTDRSLELVAADIVEVHVDAVRGELGERRAGRRLVVVEDRVEAELAEPLELLRRARAPDDRQPAIFAICPAALPTAPAAPETNTTSPSSGFPISNSPWYAVNPGIPSTPRAVEIGARSGSIRRMPEPSESAHSRQPRLCSTQAPSGIAGFRDTTTLPTAPPVIGSPSANGGT